MSTGEREKQAALLARAYREVFGQQGKRTKAQNMVLNDIESRGRIWTNNWIPREDGHTDPYLAAIAEGTRTFAISIVQMANTKPGEEPKKKPTVKRTRKEARDQ